jgi:hypothetical protein
VVDSPICLKSVMWGQPTGVMHWQSIVLEAVESFDVPFERTTCGRRLQHALGPLARVGLGTNLRLRGFRRQRTRSEQLKGDSKSAYLRRFLCSEVMNRTLFSIRTQLIGFAIFVQRSDIKGSRFKRSIRGGVHEKRAK